MSPGETQRASVQGRLEPYPAYRDSGVEWLGQIPEHWETPALKRLVDPTRPITYGIVQCGPDHPDGIPYVRPVDMHDERGVKVDDLQKTTPEIAAAYARSTIRPGDVVVSIGPSFGKAMIVPPELNGANLTQGTARVAPAPRVASPFLFWALRAESSRQAWDSYCSGATFRALTLETLGSCAVALPPLIEQRAIADFLDRETARIDALVAKKERLIELLQEKRTALISRAVTKGLDPNVPMKDSGVEWLGEIPAHWHLRNLKHVCERVFVGIAEAATFAYVDDGVPMLRSTDVRANRIRTNDIRQIDRRFADRLRSKRLRTGDIVTVRTGNAGVSAVVPLEFNQGQCFTLVVSRLSVVNDSRYFCYWLNAPVGQLQFVVEGMGTAQVNISVPIVQNTTVCVPPPDEQAQIASWIERQLVRWDALTLRTREAIDRLKELRAALISAAVTGKIDVREEA